MSSIVRSEVMSLYRAILRRGNSLTYTDREYFRRIVRGEFRKCSRDTNPDRICRNIEV